MPQSLEFELQERVKELKCIYGVSERCLTSRSSKELLWELARFIPNGFLNPAKTYCQIVYNKEVYRSDPFYETSVTMAGTIRYENREVGSIEVFLDPEVVGFLEEEKPLLKSISTMVSETLQRLKRSEELISNESLFRGFYEAGLVGLAVTSLEKGWVMVNNRLCDIFGYGRDELLKMTWVDLTYPPDLEEDVGYFNQLLDGTRDTYEMEKRFIHQKGHIVYARISVRAIRDNNGKCDHFLAMVEDISDSALSALKLKSKHEEMIRIFRKSGDPVYVVDPTTYDVVFANVADFDAEDPVAHKCYSLVFGKESPCSFCNNKELFSKKNDDPLIWEHSVGENGKYLRFCDQVIDWVDGRKLRLTTTTNISKRIAHEKQLQEFADLQEFERDRLKTILDGMDSLIYVADMETNEMLFVNKYGREIWGDYAKRKCYDVLQDGMKEPCSFCTNHRLVRDGKPTGVYVWEFQNTITKRWYECRDQAIPWTDGRLVRMEIATDITSNKKTQDSLHSALGKLKRSNEELEQFAYVASHDLQEPLRMVTSFTQLLQKKYSGELDETAHQYISYAVDGCERMHTLLNDLLSYSRVGRNELINNPIPLSEIWQSVRADFLLKIDEEKAEITHDPFPIVMGDGTMLKQLYQNLLSNALKFRRDSNCEIHLGFQRNGEQIHCTVKDNGIGISSEYHQRIFEVFQRLHSRVEYSGNGIGLSLCKKIVERHGGKIWIESSLDTGTTFHFTLTAT